MKISGDATATVIDFAINRMWTCELPINDQ